MGKISRYFKGVVKEGKRVRWAKRDEFVTAFITVIIISAITALFLSIEDLAGSTLINQLREAFGSIRG